MVALALTFAATLAAASPYDQNPEVWDRLPPEIVRQVENAIVMPNGASELTRYDRFYALEWREDRPVVVGAMVERRPEQAEGDNYRLFGPLPFAIEDGGCQVVNLVYDIESAASPELNCNGEDGADSGPPAHRVRRGEAQIVEIPKR